MGRFYRKVDNSKEQKNSGGLPKGTKAKAVRTEGLFNLLKKTKRLLTKVRPLS